MIPASTAAWVLPPLLPQSERVERLAGIRSGDTSAAILVFAERAGRRINEFHRAFDCLFDSLETFWEEPLIPLTLVVADGQGQDVAAHLIKVPRLRVDVRTPADILPTQGSGIPSGLARKAMTLALAAGSEQRLSVVLDVSVFPVAPLSGGRLLDLLADASWVARPLGEGMPPVAIIDNEAAAAQWSQLELAADAQSIGAAFTSTELAQATDVYGSHPLLAHTTIAACAEQRGQGLKRKPWNPTAGPPLLRFAGFDTDPSEHAIAKVYSSLHR